MDMSNFMHEKQMLKYFKLHMYNSDEWNFSIKMVHTYFLINLFSQTLLKIINLLSLQGLYTFSSTVYLSLFIASPLMCIILEFSFNLLTLFMMYSTSY